jgi:ribonuclease BN (tRNA processing enzyme)
LEVLGSGGPEATSRASSSYLIWVDNKAKVLIDFRGGAFLRYGESKAKVEDLEAVLFTHYHIDHSADFPALIKAGYFSPRTRSLDIYGPSGNYLMPNTKDFLAGLFSNNGAYPYMSAAIKGGDKYTFALTPHTINAKVNRSKIEQYRHNDILIETIAVNHGEIPAIAFRVTIDKKSILFSGDTSANSDNLIKLAKNVDLFVANHAIAHTHNKYARKLHMDPLRIGQISQKAKVKSLLLSHRMKRTFGKEQESIQDIRQFYKGPLTLAEDHLKTKL